jgi:hypothetical protein
LPIPGVSPQAVTFCSVGAEARKVLLSHFASKTLLCLVIRDVGNDKLFKGGTFALLFRDVQALLKLAGALVFE